MSRIGDVRDEIATALAAVPGVTVTPMGGHVDPPTLVLSPPSLGWEGFGGPPSSATFEVIAVARADEDATERLWALVDPISDVVDRVRDAVLTGAEPQALRLDNGESLPSYSFKIEVAL